MENLNALLNEKHSYQTVVIDSVDWLKKLAIHKDGNARVLFLESSPAIVAKSRYSLPDKMPLDGEAFFTKLWSIIYPSPTKK